MKTLHKLALILAIGLGAGMAGFWAQQTLQGSRLAGKPAPALTLKDLDGQPQAFAQWRGKLLLVNFWASWCAPCIDEMPLLVEAQSLYGARGLQIVGPAMDEVAAVREMAARLRINYPLMADFAEVDAAMQALGNSAGALPFTVLISPDGTLLETVLGGLKREQLRDLIESHLPASQSAS